MTMATRKVLEEVLRLPRKERAALADRIIGSLPPRRNGRRFPGIDRTPGVCGGEPCIVRTRIPVWLLERMRQLGAGEAEILRAYPTLRPSDLDNARAYAKAFPAEIERQIRGNEEA